MQQHGARPAQLQDRPRAVYLANSKTLRYARSPSAAVVRPGLGLTSCS